MWAARPSLHFTGRVFAGHGSRRKDLSLEASGTVDIAPCKFQQHLDPPHPRRAAADDGAEVGVRGSEFRIQPRGRVRRGVGAEQLQLAGEVEAVLRGIEHAVNDDEARSRRQRAPERLR